MGLAGDCRPSQAPVAIVREVAALRAAVAKWRKAGETVGLIPTMGSLHAGHLALVRRAKAECDRAVATIFVNPKQFDRKEDLASYPRNEEQDVRLLASVGCDLLYTPKVEVMYPEGFAANVSLSGLTECLDGLHRPGHFDGVATVVTKLLLQALAERAYFGEKDFQQLMIVSRLVADLDIPTEIRPVETVREPDGLALSSRNLLLTAEQRAAAPLLAQVLRETAAQLAGGGKAAGALLSEARRRLGQGGFTKVDYVELRSAETLAPLTHATTPARLLAAAWLGSTRLIDNLAVPPAD
jgi:pantoate--beta-alanine ligase